MQQKTKVILAVLFLIFGLSANVISSNIIAYYFPQAPVLPDIILNTIDGNYGYLMIFSEILLILSILIFSFILYKNKQYLTKWIFIIASFELIRGILILLTPYNTINSSSFFNNFESFEYGKFPSGHIALPFLFFLLTYKKSGLWIFFLISTILVGIFLLMSKNHYTIDILATIFIGYSIKCFAERNIFKEKC